MNSKNYFLIIIVITLAELINFIMGNLAGYFFDGFPIYYFGLFINLVLFGVIILLAWKKSLLAPLILFLIGAYTYWSYYTWGVNGFSVTGQHLQPLLVVWLALFSMAFCIIGGVYLILKRTTPKT